MKNRKIFSILLKRFVNTQMKGSIKDDIMKYKKYKRDAPSCCGQLTLLLVYKSLCSKLSCVYIALIDLTVYLRYNICQRF